MLCLSLIHILDDDKNKAGKFLNSVPVAGNRNDIPRLAEEYKIDEIYIAIPSASAKERKAIIEICRETGCQVKILPGIDVYKRQRLTYEADLPARSGLGTSSSFAVGMLNAFYALKGKYADKRKLADDAIYLERVLCKESGGVQDQIAASFGGLNRINFNADGYEVNPVIISPDRKAQLNRNLMLFFTGFSRFSSDIQKTTQKDMADKERQLLEMLSLVDEAEKVLTTKTDLNEFGRLLDYTWKLKRGISKMCIRDRL